MLMRPLKFAFIVFVLSFAGCDKHDNKDESNSIGKYLYMTDDRVLHTGRHCSNLIIAKDQHGHKVYGMEFVDTASFAPKYKFSYCTRCVNENQYEHIQKLLQRNKELKYIER